MLQIQLIEPLDERDEKETLDLSVFVMCIDFLLIFSKRQRITLRLLYAIAIPSVVCLSVCRL